MAEIVNLRRARKQRQRAEKDATAQANRVHFGQTKEARRRDTMTREQQRRAHDGHRLEAESRPSAPGEEP
ncbi:DUF4169 family protein [uncultured Rhodospira sp.]|uniref:DUF4169 family protein n=1 Tax=uncultured Rhodospira sp. TaxID=1936189 RepID=UPI002605A30B|nr:DUF4169 family protein [uncultured Rhodospira sp.]